MGRGRKPWKDEAQSWGPNVDQIWRGAWSPQMRGDYAQRPWRAPASSTAAVPKAIAFPAYTSMPQRDASGSALALAPARPTGRVQNVQGLLNLARKAEVKLAKLEKSKTKAQAQWQAFQDGLKESYLREQARFQKHSAQLDADITEASQEQEKAFQVVRQAFIGDLSGAMQIDAEGQSAEEQWTQMKSQLGAGRRCLPEGHYYWATRCRSTVSGTGGTYAFPGNPAVACALRCPVFSWRWRTTGCYGCTESWHSARAVRWSSACATGGYAVYYAYEHATPADDRGSRPALAEKLEHKREAALAGLQAGGIGGPANTAPAVVGPNMPAGPFQSGEPPGPVRYEIQEDDDSDSDLEVSEFGSVSLAMFCTADVSFTEFSSADTPDGLPVSRMPDLSVSRIGEDVTIWVGASQTIMAVCDCDRVFTVVTEVEISPPLNLDGEICARIYVVAPPCGQAGTTAAYAASLAACYLLDLRILSLPPQLVLGQPALPDLPDILRAAGLALPKHLCGVLLSNRLFEQVQVLKIGVGPDLASSVMCFPSLRGSIGDDRPVDLTDHSAPPHSGPGVGGSQWGATTHGPVVGAPTPPTRFDRELPEPDPHLVLNLTRDEVMVVEPISYDAGFSILIPGFVAERVQVRLSNTCTVEEALSDVADVRDTLAAVHFEQLVPVFPQPDLSFACVLALPMWGLHSRIGVFDTRAVDGRLFAVALAERLNRASILLHAGLPVVDTLQVFAGDELMDAHRWFPLHQGILITILPHDFVFQHGGSLETRLLRATGWAIPCPSFGGVEGPKFSMLSDGNGAVLRVDLDVITSSAFFKAEAARLFRFDVEKVTICPSVPRLRNVSVLGDDCVKQHIVFLDKRLPSMTERALNLLPTVRQIVLLLMTCRQVASWTYTSSDPCQSHLLDDRVSCTVLKHDYVNEVFEVDLVVPATEAEALQAFRYCVLWGRLSYCYWCLCDGAVCAGTGLVFFGTLDVRRLLEELDAEDAEAEGSVSGMLAASGPRSHFLILAPEYCPDLVSLNTSFPISVDDVLVQVSALREPLLASRFPRLLPVPIQPVISFACLLALPSWEFEGVPILIVCYVPPFRVMAVVVGSLLAPDDILRLVGVPDDGAAQVFHADMPWAIPPGRQVDVEPGALFTVLQVGHPWIPPVTLTAILASAEGWHYDPVLPGPFVGAVWVLTTTDHFRLSYDFRPDLGLPEAISFRTGIARDTLTILPAHPPIHDRYHQGMPLRQVFLSLADLTQNEVPFFLDQRPVLSTLVWMVAREGRVDVAAICSIQAARCPPTHFVRLLGGFAPPGTANHQRYVYPGQVLTVEFQLRRSYYAPGNMPDDDDSSEGSSSDESGDGPDEDDGSRLDAVTTSSHAASSLPDAGTGSTQAPGGVFGIMEWLSVFWVSFMTSILWAAQGSPLSFCVACSFWNALTAFSLCWCESPFGSAPVWDCVGLGLLLQAEGNELCSLFFWFSTNAICALPLPNIFMRRLGRRVSERFSDKFWAWFNASTLVETLEEHFAGDPPYGRRGTCTEEFFLGYAADTHVSSEDDRFVGAYEDADIILLADANARFCPHGLSHGMQVLILITPIWVHPVAFGPSGISGLCAWADQFLLCIAQAALLIYRVGRHIKSSAKGDRAAYLAKLAHEVTLSDLKDPKLLYQRVRRAFPASRTGKRSQFCPLPAVYNSDGDLAHSMTERQECWRQHFAAQEAGDLIEASDYSIELRRQRNTSTGRESVFDIRCVPTLADVEQTILGLQPGKATGSDGISAELLRVHAPTSARLLAGIYVKSALTIYEPVEFRGGSLIPLAKRAAAAFSMDKFRSILVSSLPGKVLHRQYRTALISPLQQVRGDLQAGALPGISTEAIIMAARTFRDIMAHRRHAWSLTFFDVRAAYYRVLRQILVKTGDQEWALRKLLHELGVPPQALQELAQKMDGIGILADAGVPEHLCHLLADAMQGTWFRIDCGTALTLTRRGVRPGDCLADVLFSFTFSAYLASTGEALRRAGVCTEMPQVDARSPWRTSSVDMDLSCASWADDFVHLAAQTCLKTIATRVVRVVEIFTGQADSIGMQLTFATDKTATMLSHLPMQDGPVQEDTDGKFLIIESPVTGACHRLPVVSAYRHLGGIATVSGTPAPEIGFRHSLAWKVVRPLRSRLFSAYGIPFSTRCLLLRSLVMSRYMFGSAALPLHAAVHRRLWAKHFVALWRVLWRRQPGEHSRHSYAVLGAARAPTPPLALALARAVLFRQMLASGPSSLLHLLFVHWIESPRHAWLGMLLEDIQHVAQYIPEAGMVWLSLLRSLTCLSPAIGVTLVFGFESICSYTLPGNWGAYVAALPAAQASGPRQLTSRERLELSDEAWVTEFVAERSVEGPRDSSLSFWDVRPSSQKFHQNSVC
ncbi:SLC38A6 [Symbiodinium microadriaticum]|nr:SLC38A6 [Symbiodinium microadriaticum]